MRLIDADKLFETIKEHSYPVHYDRNSIEKGMTITGIKEAIATQPTAYDVDKVVEELNKIGVCVSGISKNIRSAFTLEQLKRMSKAIEIVKGGVENE